MGSPICDAFFMRVLCLVTEAFGGQGGIAKYNRDFLTALCEYPEFEEVVAITRLIQGSVSTTPAKLTYVIPGPSKIKFLKAALGVCSFKANFQLVICSHINLLPIACVLSRLTQAPLVLLMYGIDVWQKHENWIVNWLLRRVSGFISISDITLEKFVAWSGLPKSKGEVLPNAIDLTKYHPGPKSSELSQRYRLAGKTVLMTLGRISTEERYKGFDEVVEVLPNILKECSNVVYMIVGDGSDRKRLESKVKEHDLESHVIFTGFVSENEKVDHYRLADVYVMPSRGEGFGFVFLEAMACGVPVIASKVDGGREAVRGGKLGLLVDPDDRQELLQAILEAIRNPRRTVKRELEYFALNNFEKRLHKIIDHILQEEAILP